MAGRLAVIREGHGEAGAIENITVRVIQDLQLHHVLYSIPPSPRFPITTAETAVRAAEIAMTLEPAAVLLTADRDDGCPKIDAPALAGALRKRSFAVPVAIVLFHPEFETVALSVAGHLGGRQLRSDRGQVIATLGDAETPDDPESTRDAKGWIGRNLMSGSSYKPTVHQLPLTRALVIDELREAGLSSFRRIESALQFLAREVEAGTANVYPAANTSDHMPEPEVSRG